MFFLYCISSVIKCKKYLLIGRYACVNWEIVIKLSFAFKFIYQYCKVIFNKFSVDSHLVFSDKLNEYFLNYILVASIFIVIN